MTFHIFMSERGPVSSGFSKSLFNWLYLTTVLILLAFMVILVIDMINQTDEKLVTL